MWAKAVERRERKIRARIEGIAKVVDRFGDPRSRGKGMAESNSKEER